MVSKKEDPVLFDLSNEQLNEKGRHKTRFNRMRKDKEERLQKIEDRKIKTTPYYRKSPRDLVDEYYLGRLTDEDS